MGRNIVSNKAIADFHENFAALSVSPTMLLESMPRPFLTHAGETPALPGWQSLNSLFSPDQFENRG
jgi:hypothetical protein